MELQALLAVHDEWAAMKEVWQAQDNEEEQEEWENDALASIVDEEVVEEDVAQLFKDYDEAVERGRKAHEDLEYAWANME